MLHYARLFVVCVLSLWCLPGNAATAEAGAAPASTGVFDTCQYTSGADGRAAWRPMEGTAPAAVALMDGRPALRMPCNFSGAKIERASWDRHVALDLTACRGIEFQLLCRDTGRR
jgi:hypothetical protein